MSARFALISAAIRYGLLTSTLFACNGTSHDAGGNAPIGDPILSPCDPLSPDATTLFRLLGIGKDTAGTIFVADEQPNSLDRVFVANGKMLRRQHITGMRRQRAGEDADYSLTFQDPRGDRDAGAQALVIQIRAGATTAMELAPSSSRDYIVDGGGSWNEPLSLVDASVVLDMKVLNIPRVVRNVIEVETGEKAVLTADMDEASPDLIRLFYGRSYALTERVINHFGQTRSGEAWVDFTLNGRPATLHFLGRAPDGLANYATLTLDNGTVLAATQVLPTPHALADSSFQCVVGRNAIGEDASIVR
jgi:hypothetical protein